MRNNILDKGLANGSINSISPTLIGAGIGALGGLMGGGGSGDSTTSTDMPAWLKEYYTGGDGALDDAKELYETGGPNYFEGDTVADLQGESYLGLDMTKKLAQGDTLNPAAGGYAESVMAGDYLGGDQFMDAYGQDIMEGVQSKFSMGGRGGSGYGTKVATAEMGDAASRLYSGERDRQNQILGNIPSLTDSAYTGADKMINSGALLQGQEQNEINADKAKWDFEENQATNNLQTYMDFLGQTPAGQTSTTSGGDSNPLISAIGGGLSGASIGSNWG